MLYHLLYPLHTHFAGFNVFRYITFRTIYAVLFGLVITFFLGPVVIRWLRAKQIGQYIREEGPQTHFSKAGTPTMGGMMILAGILAGTLLWADLTNSYVWVVVLVCVGFGLIGFADDYLMQIKKRSKGLSARRKFWIQVLVATVACSFLLKNPSFNTELAIPFFKNVKPDLGIWYVLFGVFVIVGTSNAVNLTDGLDGLAIGPVSIAAGTYMVFAYIAGNVKIANYLQVGYVAGAGELSVLCGAMVGAGMGFLWYNTYPAQIFMGDTGSLPLGAVLGAVAVATKQEFLLAIVGGIFVMETLSVIIQVGYFRLTKGKRIFRMAPLHHHFEMQGWPEPKIIVRFWIIAIILALLSASTLKLR
jgi:phospho-N-acetylmuramoyl-pentapeptide-transferase